MSFGGFGIQTIRVSQPSTPHCIAALVSMLDKARVSFLPEFLMYRLVCAIRLPVRGHTTTRIRLSARAVLSDKTLTSKPLRLPLQSEPKRPVLDLRLYHFGPNKSGVQVFRRVRQGGSAPIKSLYPVSLVSG